MRGISLEVMVGLIISILAAAIILLLIFSSGLVANFKETVGVVMIMISAYTRIAIVSILNIMLSLLAIILMIIAAFSLYKYGRGASRVLVEIARKMGGIPTNLEGLSFTTGGLYVAAVIIIYSTMVNTTFSIIPFFGSTINVYLGSEKKPYNYTLVADDIANRIDTAWKIMGANNGNPLEGLKNIANPFPVFVIFPYPNQTFDMSYVYDRLVKEYGTPDYDIYVYCENSSGILGSKSWKSNINPVCWFSSTCNPLPYTNGKMHYGGICNINNKTEVFIEYGDVMTGLAPPLVHSGLHADRNCPNMTGVGDLNKDFMAICIKEK